jgi:alpha-N-acetylglucosamine transferase
MLFNRAIPSLRLVLSSVFVLVTFFFLWSRDFTPHVPHSLHRSSNGKEYAYTTFLAAPWDLNETSSDDDDHYYTQVRMLLYQLRNDPATRSPNNYPFVVLVTEDVSQGKRERLEREGAIVKEVAKLKPLQHITRKAWQDVLAKLRLFEMVEYERVVFLDADHVLTRPMDGKSSSYNTKPVPCVTRTRTESGCGVDIFEDPGAAPQQNRNLTTSGATKPDEGPQPTTYVFASNAGSGRFNHTIPPPKGNNLNAGIVLLQPSIDLFNYYLSLTTPGTETRYNGRYPEQGLWGYAHRRDGNMPWMQLDWRWNVNWAMFKDYEVGGVASLHTKYWELDHDAKLRDFALSIKWKMEGFWEA